jgi:hypothetical protein
MIDLIRLKIHGIFLFQVSQMLDTLEREYRTIEDIHEKLKIYTDDEIQKILVDRLEQLDENKHSFLRVCFMMKRKTFFFNFIFFNRLVQLHVKSLIYFINTHSVMRRI